MTLDELIAATLVQPSKARCVHRIMTLLTHMGFFELHKEPGGDGVEEGAYGLNKVSALLAENHPQSMKVFVIGLLDFFFWSVFEGLRSLVDVGGGTGAMARAISSAFPDMECTVMDLLHVVAGMQGTDNLKFVAGDMFQKIPPANAVMLKWILHDWNDQESLKILKNCRAAIPRNEDGGKLIIIDMVVIDAKGEYKLRETQLFFDVGTMTDALGKERNEKEYAELFADAGFSSYKINPVLGVRSIIEVYP